jgi:hydroxymethylpyrimidine/phosphomethylpyrimidine kinase
LPTLFSNDLLRSYRFALASQVYFGCDDLDARVAALKEKGVAFDSGPEDQSWLWREAWLRDPAGNRLCLFFAGENRRFPPWRVDR